MVGKDIYGSKELFARWRERYISKLRPEDRGDVERLVRELLAQGYSVHRVLKYLSCLVSISRQVKKPLRELTEEDVKEWAGWLNTTSEYKAWSKHDFQVILKKYLRWLGKPEVAAWLKPKTPRNSKLPEEVLTEEEIKRMAEAAYTTRDRAFVLALYESGCRIGEFLPLKLKHVSFDRHGAVLRVEGKTGARRVRLIGSVLALQCWIEEHPHKGNPEAYLWAPLPTHNNPRLKSRHLTYQVASRILRELAQKAGVKKKVSPHAFRHARATHLAKILTEAQMKEFFGWVQSSDMASTYVHLSGRDVDGALLGAYGIKETQESTKPVIRPEPCPRCQEQNDPAAKFCRRCGMPLGESFLTEEYELREEIQRLKEEMREVARVKYLIGKLMRLKLEGRA